MNATKGDEEIMADKVLWVVHDIGMRGHVVDVEFEDDEPATLFIEFSGIRRHIPGAKWSKIVPPQKLWVDYNDTRPTRF